MLAVHIVQMLLSQVDTLYMDLAQKSLVALRELGKDTACTAWASLALSLHLSDQFPKTNGYLL